MKSVFFIPVFNQVRELPGVLEELGEAACSQVLLVNNGSLDGSEKLVREAGHPYLDLPHNHGIGYGYQRALEWALERDFQLFGVMAGNGKMLAADMPRLLEPLQQDRADYVTGSRYLEGGSSPNLPLFRRATIPLVNLFVRALTGRKMTDATCGYRAFRLDLIRRAEFDWRASWLYTYGLEYYLDAKAARDGRIRFREVPVTMRYPGGGRRYSKIRPFVDWWAILKPFIVARFDGRGFRRD